MANTSIDLSDVAMEQLRGRWQMLAIARKDAATDVKPACTCVDENGLIMPCIRHRIDSKVDGAINTNYTPFRESTLGSSADPIHTDRTVVITVDKRDLSTFEISEFLLAQNSTYFHRYFANSHKRLGLLSLPTNTSPVGQVTGHETPALLVGTGENGPYIPYVSTCDFSDFWCWLKGNRILKLPIAHAPWAFEYAARRLVKAIALGVLLESEAFQQQAMIEFIGLAKFLDAPEDHVNSIFTATALDRQAVKPHPARRMIVAVVAAKSIGRGKRRARQGPRDKNVERGDRIAGGEFWDQYDAYIIRRMRGGECEYPKTIRDFMW